MKQNIRKIFTFILAFSFFSLSACNTSTNISEENDTEEMDNNTQNENQKNETSAGNSNFLIAYFSREGENYNVGTVEKGNTQIVAEIIQSKTNADIFKIERATPYPTSYSETLNEVRNERGTRPELLEDIDISKYTHIFLGYPIWNADMPMPVYTFIESHNWEDKTIIPFNTHEGSGQASTISTIRSKCVGATVLNGISIRGTTAQTDEAETINTIKSWLSEMNLPLNSDADGLISYKNVSVSFSSKPSEDETKVINAYMRMQQATIDKDMQTLNAIIDDNKIFTHMSRAKQTKQEFLSEIENGTLNYYKSELSDIEISISRELSSIKGKNTLTAKVYGIEGTWTLNINAFYKLINNEWILVNE